jgi:uncharacterized protein with ParB-like and HNH nuclease domain
MNTKNLLLKEMSIKDVFNGEKATYEIPIYQRNYAWEEEEISALIQDVFDAYDADKTNTADKRKYFIGTLVSFQKGDKVYEVIDGQQRLTAISLILNVLKISMNNKLTYRARKKSNDTIKSISSLEADEKDIGEVDEKDIGIVKGYKYAIKKINEVVPNITEKKAFGDYFCEYVHLIHYHVPRDIDLNHYFEIMNSRGEQLEKHEIIKARLIEEMEKKDRPTFNQIWESCSEMNVYIQQKHADAEEIFGKQLCDFKIKSFDDLPAVNDNIGVLKIADLINHAGNSGAKEQKEKIDTFQPIMDFTNFLLVVLKLSRIDEKTFDPVNFSLDDKQLLNEFDKLKAEGIFNADFVKRFGFNLLKAKYLLDNYLVHHSDEDDIMGNKPWKLQRWQRDGNKGYLKNLDEESEAQQKLVYLLSMFEVSFTARQRKNYLFYCLLYLFKADNWDVSEYCKFVSNLADKYFYDVYLENNNLNEIKIPRPGSFDGTLLVKNVLDIELRNKNLNFTDIYGNGKEKSAGISLFIFNYLDYKLWEKYFNELRGEKSKKGDKARSAFFEALGCDEFDDLKVFDQFYFSRTRRSLEHFFPQAKAAKANGENNTPTVKQINCLGNYAMIGSEVNSSGSDWYPRVKLDHYLDHGKIRQVSVASIKFMVMMQMCEKNLNKREYGQEWTFADILAHQSKMLDILGVK